MSQTIYVGVAGAAERVEMLDCPGAADTVCLWLITSPVFHPMFGQYLLCATRLGRRPLKDHDFLDSTHEVLVITLNPADDVQETEDIARHQRDADLSFILPLDVRVQFIATDEEMDAVIDACAHAVANGYLCPDTKAAPEQLQTAWLSTLVKSLAHCRGEVHAP